MQKQVYCVILLVLLLLVAIGLSACKKTDAEKTTAADATVETAPKKNIPLVGSWIPSDSENASMQYDFSADGTLKITLAEDHIIDALWELDGNTLSVSSADTVQKYEIEVSGDRLTFIYENGTIADWVRK